MSVPAMLPVVADKNIMLTQGYNPGIKCTPQDSITLTMSNGEFVVIYF